MKVFITPRFERSKHGSSWYAFEQDLVDLVHKTMRNEVVLLTPQIGAEIAANDLLLLSGGQSIGVEKSRDDFELNLLELALQNEASVLGICRGAQLIATKFGAKLFPVEGHVNSVRGLTGEATLGICFHESGIFELEQVQRFKILSRDKVDGSIELFHDVESSILGIAAHPERHENSQEYFGLLLSKLKL